MDNKWVIFPRNWELDSQIVLTRKEIVEAWDKQLMQLKHLMANETIEY